MLKFLKYLGQKKWFIIVIVFLILVQACCDLLLPIFMGEVISLITEHSSSFTTMDIVFGSLKMFGAALGSSLCAVITGIISSRLTAFMTARVRYNLYSKIMLFSAYEKKEFGTSTLVTRVTNDINNVSTAYIMICRFAFYGPLITIAAFVLLLINNFKYQIALLIAAAFLLLILIIYAVVRLALPHYRVLQSRIDKVNLLTKENLEGLRVIRAYNAEAYHQEKIDSSTQKLMKDNRFANRCLAFLNPVVQLTAGILLVGITLLSSYLIKDNQFNFAGMTVAIQFSVLLLTGFVSLMFVIVLLPRLLVSSNRINEILELKLRIQDNQVSPTINQKGIVEFRNVSFSYPGSPTPSLQNISFKVNQGETIAFIGATGSGKTTIINLILRSFDTSSGSVLVDDIDVKKYHLKDLFHRFGYVPQKPYLFRDTLRHNIFLGNVNASNQDYQDAINISQTNEFINKLEKGENYEISQGGKNVSGGQRQRISIARALIKKPEIFIFDDSFSALDYRTDKTIRSAIRNHYKQTTNIIVAQRVGTIMDADQIIVLDNGIIVGKGTHKGLLKSCKIYRDIALSQLGDKELLNAQP
ncbi:MAG: ABC transporter ATP-binding protein/permease [Bacilli bacterium]|nr:ABC transporter ATP-binding protein/permease [Bacilli bacterium]